LMRSQARCVALSHVSTSYATCRGGGGGGAGSAGR
jgi:hypothetical protein